jgi:hypothetical protein
MLSMELHSRRAPSVVGFPWVLAKEARCLVEGWAERPISVEKMTRVTVV